MRPEKTFCLRCCVTAWCYSAWHCMTNTIWQCRPRVYLSRGHEVISCLAIAPYRLSLIQSWRCVKTLEVILEELISFFETDKHTEAYHVDQLTTGYYYCRNSTQTKGDPFSLQEHPVMCTVLRERFSFNREIFIWAPVQQANNPKVLVSGPLLNTRSSIFDIFCLTLTSFW